LRAASFVAVTGPVLHLVAGLDTPSEGEFVIAGVSCVALAAPSGSCRSS
jgi:hypothetical protein